MGAQAILAPPAASGAATDRYIRQPGVIMFDSRGNVVSLTYGVHTVSKLARQSGRFPASDVNASVLSGTVYVPTFPTVANPNFSLVTQVAVCLYDLQSFTAQGFSDEDAPFNGTAYTAGTPTEQAEETWLDSNATPLLVNRYNGRLIRGE